MNRLTKFGVCMLLAALSLVFLIVVGAMIASSRIGYGGDSPQAQTTVWGWAQLVMAALGTTGFSATAIWQALAAFIESRGVSKGTTNSVVDFTKVTSILAILKVVPPGPTRDNLLATGRAACDEMKDNLFPNPVAAS